MEEMDMEYGDSLIHIKDYLHVVLRGNLEAQIFMVRPVSHVQGKMRAEK